MADSANNPYLRDAVLTAPPEQLQLMLYDGAIRFALQGRDAIRADDAEKTYEVLTRAQKIMLELINGLREEVDPPLVKRVSSIYMYIYRKLVEANVNKDIVAVDDALKLLQYQRETWVLLLKKLRTEQTESESVSESPSVPPAELSPPAEEVLEPVIPTSGRSGDEHSDYQPLSVEG